jgi:glycosyltransferase involved in cell wall biosynthesis
VMLDEERRRAAEFDVLHYHIDLLHFPVVSEFADRTITTVHGRLDTYDLQPCFAAFPGMPLVSVSREQRRPLGQRVLWAGNVYHGLPRQLLGFTQNPRGDYFAFLGRISPEKRPDRAIEIAARTGIRLKIAAKVDRVDEEYWRREIAPMIAAHPNVEYVGEINEQQKAAFLGNARALLFPIDWPEPFGLVMIEAMACGTPVIGFRCGSVPEVIDEGITGCIVSDLNGAVAAVRRIHTLDRRAVRLRFEERFTAQRMAHDYLDVYARLPGFGRLEADRAGGSFGRPSGMHEVA